MIHIGNCTEVMRRLEAGNVQTCVTSPPYYGLRDYDLPPTDWPEVRFKLMADLPEVSVPAMSCCLGHEETVLAYVGHLVAIFREVHRLLSDDGTAWLNLGDSYAGNGGQSVQSGPLFKGKHRQRENVCVSARIRGDGLKPKDLTGIPWMVAFALRADGWYLRQDIIWAKPNPMPESVRDRCTKAHEYLFLLAKSERYYFDADAIAEPAAYPDGPRNTHGYRVAGERVGENHNLGGSVHKIGPRETRNKRSVWSVATAPYREAHFATFPQALIEPCILAATKPDDLVLDPFMGAGTTAVVAERLGRRYVGAELNPSYVSIAASRLRAVQPGLALGGAMA